MIPIIASPLSKSRYQPAGPEKRSRLFRGFHVLAPRIVSFSIFILFIPLAWANQDWLPVSPEELKMTSDPNAAGAPAIYLYRQLDRNDLTY